MPTIDNAPFSGQTQSKSPISASLSRGWTTLTGKLRNRDWLLDKLVPHRSTSSTLDFGYEGAGANVSSGSNGLGRVTKFEYGFSEEGYEILAKRFRPRIVKKIALLFDSPDLGGQTFEVKEQIKTRDALVLRRRNLELSNLKDTVESTEQEEDNLEENTDIMDSISLTWYGVPSTTSQKDRVLVRPSERYPEEDTQIKTQTNQVSLIIDEPDFPPKYELIPEILDKDIRDPTYQLWKQQRDNWTMPASDSGPSRLPPVDISDLPTKSLPLIYDQMVIKGKPFKDGRGMKLADALLVIKSGWVATNNWPPPNL
ncbi:hypothetical protein NADFUDRAFT_50173 [Nadsonia fulvescens var. elongata DSM 6958]|uniref:DUF4050 domain-containing protein n=1 Tax=Nadsonia fulvescens var. elongata DSM 6958 TaxID=857566 RepID=A0A1E3PMT4_9ASCO|nr:hypothetical protein NADFUDRAFT_50173 [Nadsonia fulvescens var. elongata DSM 6958]